MQPAALEVKKPNGSETALTMPEKMLEIALSNNAAIDVIERLVALQRESMTQVALREFNTAMNAAQAEMERIAPDLFNAQTKSKYPSYAAIDRKIRPVYTKHGFSLSFDEGECDKPEIVRVLCYVSHTGGYTRTYKKDMPADGKGPQGGAVMSRTHASAAADSYGMRYLVKKIFNIAIGEDDVDGNPVTMSEDTLKDFDAAKTYEELDNKFKAAFKAASGNTALQQEIIAAKDRRRGQMRAQNPVQGVELNWGKKNA